MATTCTSELIFGKADQNSSGIQFNHRLMLYEGLRTMLVFERKPSLSNGGQLIDRWVPHVDAMVEAAMLMMAGDGVENPEVISLIDETLAEFKKNEMIDLSRVSNELMERLYAASRHAFKLEVYKTKHSISSDRWKVTACLFTNSSIQHSLQKFLEYDIDLEVCRSVYQREYSPRSDSEGVWGELI